MRWPGGAADLDNSDWPPSPRDRFSGWAARRVARMAGWRIALALLIIIVLWNGLILGFFLLDRADEYRVIYSRYNDALVDADPAAAWALGCRADRDAVSLAEFTTRLDRAVAPLGGLQSWIRLRGGPRWNGPNGSETRKPRIETVDGHKCVRLGENPLGEPF